MIDLLLDHRAHAPEWLIVDAGDDGAVLADGQVVTVDALVEGVHFDHRLSAADVGFKSVAVSVSDLAAMGATPRWMVCALSLPRGPDTLEWVADFASGLHEACATWNVYLLGGDVTSVPDGSSRCISNTLAGQVSPGCALRRTGAAPGDDLWVTGVPGLAGAGWMWADPPDAALEALRRPAPPLAFAQALSQQRLTTAAMDLSDGLLADAPRLGRASRVLLQIDPDRLPVPEPLAGHPERERAQLAGGDDYQLLFTAPRQHRAAVRDLAAEHHVLATRFGIAAPGAGAAMPDGSWPQGAYDHFPSGAAT